VKWESRLLVVERIVAQEEAVADRWAEHHAETERRVNEMFGHVPESLQDAVINSIESETPVDRQLCAWLKDPFEVGALPFEADYRFPAMLVEFRGLRADLT
jgi:hypothetical protein